MSKEHLDALAIAACVRTLCWQVLALHRGHPHGCCAGLCARGPSDSIWASAGTDHSPRPVRDKACPSIVDTACRVQRFALRTDIDIASLVECEVLPAQRAVLAPRLVDDRNVWFDLLIDDPIERLRRAISMSAARYSGLRSKHSSVRSIIVFAARTSACRMARSGHQRPSPKHSASYLFGPYVTHQGLPRCASA
jgi:hypothetical protein